MITHRQANILRIIVEEYISKGIAVGSDTVSHIGLTASSATIRNEMCALEEEGYLFQPHTSAGRVPSIKGYRWYIDEIMDEVQLPPPEQRMISHQFHQVEKEVDEWIRLAATILSRMLNNVAIVTLPKAGESHLKHIELVPLHEREVLVIVILKEGKLLRNVIVLDEPISQENLDECAQNLKERYNGLAFSQIVNAANADMPELEQKISEVILKLMQLEAKQEYGEPYIDGLRHILNHPELVASSRTKYLFELLEQKSTLRSLLPKIITGDKIHVIIGGENEEEAMRDCSLIVTRYGISGEVGGAIGVVGPMRMHYNIAIPTVNFLSKLMSELVV